jgi:hypothetical protein
MSLDLEGLALIDTMLDAIIELRLMPDVWTEKECSYLEKIHNSILRLNRYWENWESMDLGGMEIICLRNILVSIVGYAELLSFALEERKKGEMALHLQRLERLGKLIRSKIDYLNSRLLRDY